MIEHDGRYAVLHLTVAEAARRAAADRVALIDVGRPAGLNLGVDRVAISYDGTPVAAAASPVQVECSVVGDESIPMTPLPVVEQRMVVHRAPLNPADPNDRAEILRSAGGRSARLAAEIELVATLPAQRVAADPVVGVSAAVAAVPDDVLPVVLTTWSLSRFGRPRRARFVDALVGASTSRTLAWVSVEGVGVAPTVPTLGDRPASGHSIMAVALYGPARVDATAVGRCWSRGRFLSWFARPGR
ncbi:DUF2332 family protein [Gordonia aurantiaca]|uniref:DUF2332 family protein n=1 Tax=Gordonia sp. B21 TaxID=3151852 RepID=UPI0032672799